LLKGRERGFLAGGLVFKGFVAKCCFGALDLFRHHHHHRAKEDLERMCVWEEEKLLMLSAIATILI
jgi:hypothetical protein